MAELIFGNGINQGDLYDFLKELQDEWEDLLQNLDADALTSSAYEATYEVTLPASVSGTGMSWDDVVTFLDTFITNFNAVLAVLDADTTKTTAGYVTACAITDVVDNAGTGNIFKDGVNQGNLVNLLQTILTKFAALTARLDADTDTGVTKTDYSTIALLTDIVNTDGCNDLIGGYVRARALPLIWLLALLIGAMFMARPKAVISEVNTKTQTPVYQARTLNGIDIYMVGGATTNACSFQVCETSAVVRTFHGIYPGTHTFILANYTYETLISSMNGLSVTGVAGVEGGIVAALSQGSYGANPATLLGVRAQAACKGLANKKTLLGTDAYGITYILAADDLGSEQQYHLTGGMINVSYDTSYAVTFTVYDGTTTANTIIDKEVYKASGVDGRLDISPNGELAGSENRAMRLEVACSTNITAGWMCIQGFRE